MEVRLLGPLEVLSDGTPVQLGGRQRRTLLAILAVHAGDAVTTDGLINQLWGDSPPNTARKTVQSHVAHLRKALNNKSEVLAPAEDGYIIRIDEGSIDTNLFEEQVREARVKRSTDPSGAVATLDRALSLFRGPALAGLADDAFSLRVEATRIEELRLSAIEDRLDAMIAAGAFAEAVAECERLVAEHPLRERLWGLLMLALYRSGRQAEALQAFSRARQTLAEELGLEPSQELNDLEQRILDQDPILDQAVAEILRPQAPEAPLVRNPYKGLRAFDEADARDFFGRDDLVRRLLERIELRGGPPVVVLAGPSGAGKSSAVRAGLIPALRDRGHEVAVMFPGADPLASLAKAVSETTDASPGDLLDELRDGEAPRFDGFVVVDQFEELFTMVDDSADLDHFLELSTDNRSSVRWVVTARADFLDRLLSHRITGPILEDALILVPPLQEHEVAAAVTRPAERVGVTVDPELVRRVVEDIRSQSSALPLLQFALTDTFERRSGGEITLVDYESGGGISGALSRRADELYESLDAEHQEATRQLFLNLIGVTEEGEGIRRRVERETLLTLPVHGAALAKVIERLGAQRLLTFDQDPETGAATVEVAHEALIAEWPRLAEWITEARDDLRTRLRLKGSVDDWIDADSEPAYLLAGARLDQFAGWAETTDLDLTEAETTFIDASLAADLAKKQALRRRRRVVGGGIAAAVTVAIVLGSLAISQRAATDEQARLVRVGDLAADSVASLEVDPELAILLALEAVETTRRVDGSVLDIAEDALHRAVLADRLLESVGNPENGLAHFSPDGKSFITIHEEDETLARIWTVDPFTPAMDLSHDDLVLDGVFSPDGTRVATTSLDGNVRIFDVGTGRAEVTISTAPEHGVPFIPVFSNDGSMVAATSFSGFLLAWDAETGELIHELPPPPDTTGNLNLEFSPDDTHLAAAYFTELEGAQGARMWNLETQEVVETFLGHDFDVLDVGFTPDGTRLVTSSFDTTLKVWDVGTGDNLATYSGHEGPVNDLQISADGTFVASSGFVDVRVWDLETLETTAVILGHKGEVDAIDISPDGEMLVTSSRADKTTRLWDLTDYWSHESLGLPGPVVFVGAVDFSPDGGTLAASRDQGMVTVWDSATGEEIRTLQVPGPATFSLAHSPDGTLLAGAGPEGVIMWDVHSGQEVRTLHDAFSVDVSFHPDGTSLLTSSGLGLQRWDVAGGDPTTLQPLLTYSASFSPEGSTVATSHDDEGGLTFFVEFLDASDGSVIADLGVGFQLEGSEHNRPVNGLAYNHDGSLLVTASEDATAILWDTTTLEVVHRLEGHVGPVNNAAFDPTREEVATVSADGTVRIWSVDTGTTRLTLPMASGAVSDLSYSSDGRYLAAVSDAGIVTVYILDVDELADEAVTRLTRWWTPGECTQHLETETCPEPPVGFIGSVEGG